VDQYGKVRPPVTRHYDTLSQAAYENAQSRIYLGIHWPWDRDQGLRLGSEVADYTIRHVLQPVSHQQAQIHPSTISAVPIDSATPTITAHVVANSPPITLYTSHFAAPAYGDQVPAYTSSSSGFTGKQASTGVSPLLTRNSNTARDMLFQ